MGSFECALEVIGFTLWVVVFIRARSGNRRNHSGSLVSFGCALGVVEFIRACRACLWVHSGAARPWGHQFHFRSLVSFGRVLLVVAFNIGFIPARPGFIRILSGALLYAFRMVAFIRARPGSGRVP